MSERLQELLAARERFMDAEEWDAAEDAWLELANEAVEDLPGLLARLDKLETLREHAAEIHRWLWDEDAIWVELATAQRMAIEKATKRLGRALAALREDEQA